MSSYTEPGRTIPIARSVDVVVVGGGPAGIAAALAARRSGCSVLLIEQFNSLGGVGGPGLHNHISQVNAHGSDLRVVGGLAWELGQRIVADGAGDLGSCFDYDPEQFKYLCDRWMQAEGVELLYHTFLADVVKDGNALVGVIVQNKSGRQMIAAREVIDCTGDGDVGYLAGAPWEQGREGDSACQPVTMMFRMGGVDWPRVAAWRKDYQCQAFFEDLQARGEMEPFQNQIMGFWHNSVRPDQVGINFTHMIKVDCTKAEQLTAATLEGRRQVHHCVEVFRRHIPGFEQGYLIDTAATIGLRESRRILGEVVIEFDDLVARREWPDTIGYGSFFVDIHNLDGPGMSHTTLRPEPGFRYQLPYRCLVPRDVDHLLTAGRCVSCTHRALGSIRVMITCMVLGEAAGVAAAQAIAEGVAPRMIDTGRLQAELRARGCLLTEADLGSG